MQHFGILLHCSAVLTVLTGIVNAAPRSDDVINLFPRETTPGGTQLIPYFIPKSLLRRDQIPLRTSEDSTPSNPDIEALGMPEAGQAVELFYGEEKPTSTDPFITKITFTPSADRVLLVLENYLTIPGAAGPDGALFTRVTCEVLEQEAATNATLVINKATIAGQFDQWLENLLADEEKELVVITPGCGKRERLAFLVNAAEVEVGSLTTSLIGVPLDWSSVAIKLSIKFGKASTLIPSFGSRASLTKRFDLGDLPGFFTSTVPEFVEDTIGGGDDEDEGNDEDDDGIRRQSVNLTEKVPGIPTRLQLLPLPSDILPKIDVPELPFTIPFLPEEDGQNYKNETDTGSDPGLTVTCVDCKLSGELDFFGTLKIETKLFDFDPSERLGMVNVKSASIGVNVTEDIVARLGLEFKSGETSVGFAFQQSIFPFLGVQSGIPIFRFGIPKVFELAQYFDYEIGVSVFVSTPETNVTFGGEFRVPKGSYLSWDMADKNGTRKEGWDVDVTSFPVKVNSAPTDLEGFSLGVNFTSVPSITLGLGILPQLEELEVSVGARLAMLLPRVYTKSTVVKNVTSSCTSPGADDYTYFPTAVLFESGLHTALYGELYAETDIPSIGQLNLNLTAGVVLSHTFWEDTLRFNDSCLLFGDSKTGLGELRKSTTLDAESERMYDLVKIEQKYTKDGILPPAVDVEKLKKQEGLPENLKTALFDNKSVKNVEEGGDAPGGSDEENAASRIYHGWLNGNWTVWVAAVVAISIGNGFWV